MQRCELNSLSQSLMALPAPSGREPLAKPETLPLCKGPILEGAVAVGDWGSSLLVYPFRQSLRLCHLPQGDGFSGGGKVSGIAQRRPLGGAGKAGD